VRQGVTGIARLRRRARERERHPQLARVLHPPKTFINHKVLSPRRTFATATIPFADVKATAKELGVKINDLILATPPVRFENCCCTMTATLTSR
jgi:hypothetical protein